MRRALVLLLISAPVLGQAAEPFRIESGFGDESRWTAEYLERCHTALVRLMDNRKVEPPRGIEVRLEKDPRLRGIAGAASPTSLSFTSDRWPEDRNRLWILAHELTNLFAAHYGGAGGYPSDWWSNGRSPFPEYVSCLVMKKLGYAEEADWRRKSQAGKPDHQLFWKLDHRFGFKLFARFLSLIREDGIDLGGIGERWPRPDEVRSAYAIAYLSRAADTDLTPLFLEHGIGREPDDWRQRHPSIPFRAYEVSAGEVERILSVRGHLFSSRGKGRGGDILRDLFRRGRTWIADAAPAAGESPIEFEVKTEFGAESEWTREFLEDTAATLAEALEIPRGLLPRVPVTLGLNPDAGGVAGGAGASRIDFSSNCWPKERFRLWFLSQSLAKLVSFHIGGNLPEDWWGHGGKPFAAYASSLALGRMGQAEVAAWVRAMHRGRADHELLWTIHDKHDPSWAPRFFRLLREDGLDVARLGGGGPDARRIQSLYLVAYLSIACDENLADACASAGIGAEPAGWGQRNPGVPFREYRFTVDEVDRLTALRERLFAKGGDDARLTKERERYLRGETGR